MQFKSIVLITWVITLAACAQAQYGIVPLQLYYTNQFEIQHQDSLYTPLTQKPFFKDRALYYQNRDTLKIFGPTWFKKIQTEGWVNYQYKPFDIHINLLPNFSYGKEIGKSNFYNNIRGIQAYGNITSKLFYQTLYYESQSTFPQYLSSFVADTGVVPGQGRVKGLINKKSFDYGWAETVLSYKPNEYFDMAFGQNRNHIGFGYRSMLLSDNALPYLNLRFNFHFGRIHYSSIYAVLNNYQKGPVLSQGYEKKYFAAHYLDFFPQKNIELGLFETVVWPNADSSGHRGFELNYLNPIIFYHATQNYLGSPDNSIIGLNIRYRLFTNFNIYGQFVLDDLDLGRSKQKGFYRNKMALQAGIKWLEVFNITGLVIRVEMNQAQPYTYSHKIPSQSYTAMQQPLAHPLGANFREWVFMAFYEKKRWSVDMSFIYAVVGKDIEGMHEGNNIFISDYLIPGFPKSYHNTLLQGIKTDIINAGINIHYLLLPINRTTLDISLQHRVVHNDIAQHLDSNFISFGIRTSLFNSYYDF